MSENTWNVITGSLDLLRNAAITRLLVRLWESRLDPALAGGEEERSLAIIEELHGMLDEVARGWPSHVSADLDQVALTRDEVRERMSGNLCRCAAYPTIVDAICDVAGVAE